ncbi:MAG: flagellar biosynthesis protein FlhF [Deltaproteobacteria bacterium]|nr:flagellar biosynthesis protein FlhF [Deltaproteobacteria bacterium]
MQIKRYEARSMRDGLEQVKSDLGAEAIILSAKNIEPPAGLRGGGQRVEIIAANDLSAPEKVHPAGPAMLDVEPELEPIKDDIRQLKDLVSRLVFPRVPLPRGFDGVFQEMVFQGVRDEVALKLVLEAVENLGNSGDGKPPERKAVIEQVIQRFPPPAPILLERPGRRTVVALVGPTGVGKTTTLVKLAALFALKARKRVALVTVDSYRIAATEQLKVYGRIMDLPVVVVENRREMEEALSRLEGVDLVLIDTAGRTHRDRLWIHQLKGFFADLPVMKCLVLCCHTKQGDLDEIAGRFRLLGLDRLVFTKLDEAATFGAILNTAFSTGLALSYLTIGQRVPEDICEASPRIVSQLIFSRPGVKEARADERIGKAWRTAGGRTQRGE